MYDGAILLADDNEINARQFVKVLRMGGMENKVVHVRDGVEVLDYLFGTGKYAGRDTTSLPRLAVLDISMPRMDGLEALRRLRADERTALLPVVVFSASGMPQDVERAYRLGANAYVDKASVDVPYPVLVRRLVNYWLTINEPPPVLTRSS